MYFVKVYGPNIKNTFGCDSYKVDGPASVADHGGVLIIITPASQRWVGDRLKTYGPSQVAYARGEWTKTVVTEVLDEKQETE